jgi:hypothetical protein
MAKLLKVIHETIDAGRIEMTDEEAVILYRDKISVFVKTHARKPNINSTDLLERRMAEAFAKAALYSDAQTGIALHFSASIY